MPLAMYHIFSQQMSSKKAFLAVFFFVSVPTFSLEMISLPRQQIAELFLVLVILLLVDRKLSLGPKLTLLIMFAMSIIVSHYSLGFIGFIYMGLLLPFAFVVRNGTFQKAWGWLTRKVGGLPRSLTRSQALPGKILIILVVVYFVSGFVWYGITASGVNLNLVKSLLLMHAGGTDTEVTEFTGLPAIQFIQRDALVQTALGLDFPQASPQGKVFRVFQYVTELFLIVGCIRLIFRPKHLRFTAEYIAMSLVSALLILGCIFLPNFAKAFNTSRWYHIALIKLAPFCILGGEDIGLGVRSLWRKLRHIVRGMSWRAEAKQSRLAEAEDSQGALKFIALAVLIPYFLLTSGFIYEVTGMQVTDKIETPYSIALSSYRLDLAGVFYWRDGAAAEWLARRAGSETNVYGDSETGKLLIFSSFPGATIHLPPDVSKTQKDSDRDLHGYAAWLIHPQEYASEPLADAYLYFSAWNIQKKEVTFNIRPGLRRHLSFDDIPGLTRTIDNKNRIYNNGGAQILR
jgi:uncharacterized membrane protein